MLSDPIFRSFSSERPIAVMAQMALVRLLDAEVVDDLFAKNAEEQYERTLLFSSLTHLMASVVMGKQRSVNSAYKKMRENVGVSLNALYNKLDRVEPRISQALVRHSYEQAMALQADLGGTIRNEVAGYRMSIFDGNHLSKTDHRIAETRNSTAAPLPGKSVVVLDPRRQAIKDYFPIEDGHAQERRALDEILSTVQAKDLWVGDRNFCTLKPLYEIASRKAAFVIRHHKKLEGEGLGKRRKIGTCETGIVYERTMDLSPYQGKRMTVRRIEVDLNTPTRDKDKRLVILTNLPEKVADGLKIADLYRKRWRIETAFQTLTVSLNCEIKTLCYPKAALFAFALAVVAYNAIAIVLTAVRSERGAEEADQLSPYYMALEIAQTTDGMLVAIPPERWLQFASVPPSRLAKAMRTVAREIDIGVYRKAVSRPRKPRTKKINKKNEVHVSTAKILAARKEESAC